MVAAQQRWISVTAILPFLLRDNAKTVCQRGGGIQQGRVRGAPDRYASAAAMMTVCLQHMANVITSFFFFFFYRYSYIYLFFFFLISVIYCFFYVLLSFDFLLSNFSMMIFSFFFRVLLRDDWLVRFCSFC